jgi:DNA-binding HxlR family transcriptional regulator
MVLLELLGRRWLLRVIWELRGAPLTFRELQAACGDISPTVLNRRLHELRECGIVVQADEGGYTLSESGRELFQACMQLHLWADRWGDALQAD